MKRVILFFTILVLSCANAFAAGTGESSQVNSSDSIVVFTAASTIDVMQTLADLFESETGHRVFLNPASSGTLAKQLAQGAEGDIFISASKKWIDYTVDEGLVAESHPFAGNRMVLIAPADSPERDVQLSSEYDFPGSFTGRLSMGDPAHVPAGAYAERALEYFGWYDILSDRILPASNVRAALSVVELAETERGIVYRTDALKSEKVKILGMFPEESHDPVSYFSALLNNSSEGAKEFYYFVINGDKTESVLNEYGFDLKF